MRPPKLWRSIGSADSLAGGCRGRPNGGAKAACEGRGHLEGGEVARDRDWHGPPHLKRAWLTASTAILPLSPSFYVWPPGRGDFLVSNIHPGAIPGNVA